MRRLHKLLMVPVLAAGLGAVGATSTSADSSKYDLHGGDGFGPLQEPDVASASDGATITVQATGSFHVTSGKASSTLGTFVHRNADGSVAGTGTFTVTGLRSFAGFGCGVADGQSIPSNLCGGYAVFSIHAVGHPASGGTEEFNAVLGVDCVIGDHVPPGAKEGIVLDVPGLIN